MEEIFERYMKGKFSLKYLQQSQLNIFKIKVGCS